MSEFMYLQQREQQTSISESGFRWCRLACFFCFLLTQLGSSIGSLAVADDKRGTLVVDSHTRSISLLPYIQYLRLPEDNYSIAVLQQYQDFAQYESSDYFSNFGASDDTYWFVFKIENQDTNKISLVMELDNPLIDSVTIYGETLSTAIDESHPPEKLFEGGNLFPYSQREIKTNVIAKKLMLHPGERQRIYVKLSSLRSGFFPLKIYGGNSYYQKLYSEQIFNGTILGIMCGLLAYNLILLGSTRRKDNFYYVMFILFSILSLASRNNYLYVLWPEHTRFNLLLYSALPLLVVAANFQFGRRFLNAPVYFTKIDRWIRWFPAYALGSILVSNYLLDVSYLPTLFFPPALVVAGLIFWMALERLKHGYYPAKLFLVGISISFIAGLIIVPAMYGYASVMAVYNEMYSIADAVQMVLYSLALAASVNQLEEEKNNSEKLVLKATAGNEAKSKFLTQMSHEIRTPMNGVLGLSELLKDTTLNSNQQHYVNIIHSSGQSLLTIVNDILDFANIKEGNIKLENITFNLENVLRDCSDIFGLSVEKKKIRLICASMPDVPKIVKGDATRLRQIIINLLGNAFKFTHEGEISVIVSVDDSLADGGVVLKFRVTDTGIGISEENQKKLFSAYSQAEESVARQYGGTGLGLTISQQLVEKMGGSLRVDSVLEQGTTFTFTVKFQCGDQNEVEPVFEPKHLAGRRLLVADPNNLFRAALTELAISWGMDVVTVEHGCDVTDIFLGKDQLPGKFDFLLLSNDIDDRPAIGVATEVRAYVPKENLAIILLTAVGGAPTSEQLEEAGIDASIAKPTLLNRIESILDGFVDALSDQVGAENQLKPTDVDNSLENIKVLVAEDNLISQKVVVSMLKKFGVDPVIANDGLEVVELFCENLEYFDLILMDCEMPNLDGYGATEQIRAYEKEMRLDKSIPIIALSAHAMQEHKEKSISSGMNAHISKPVQMNNLRFIIQRIVTNSENVS